MSDNYSIFTLKSGYRARDMDLGRARARIRQICDLHNNKKAVRKVHCKSFSTSTPEVKRRQIEQAETIVHFSFIG